MILATLAYTVCRAGAVAKLRLGDLQHDGTQYVPLRAANQPKIVSPIGASRKLKTG
jgi:hypothetical protein